MARFEDGEYMNMVWDGPPDAHYIRGHVSHEEGIKILLDAEVIDEETVIGQAEHIYGRWSVESDGNQFIDGPSNNLHILREYQEPGRGRFKITCFGLGIFAKPKININQKKRSEKSEPV